MAGLLFVYSRTSIRAAKLNAQRHREADGGQLDWQNQSRRHHGQAERVPQGTLREALTDQVKGKQLAGTPGDGSTASRPTVDIIQRDGEQGKALEEAKAGKRVSREG